VDARAIHVRSGTAAESVVDGDLYDAID